MLYLSCFIKIGDTLSRNSEGYQKSQLSSQQGDDVKTQNGGINHINFTPTIKSWFLQASLA